MNAALLYRLNRPVAGDRFTNKFRASRPIKRVALVLHVRRKTVSYITFQGSRVVKAETITRKDYFNQALRSVERGAVPFLKGRAS